MKRGGDRQRVELENAALETPVPFDEILVI